MKHKLLLIATILLLGLALGCNAQENEIIEETNPVRGKKSSKTKNKKVKNNMNVLARGSYSKVETPFFYVARDNESLQNLSELSGIKNLNDELDFEKNIVLAAFGGTHRKGGYSVEFGQMESKIFVKLNKPPKGAMVTQALTQPFQIISLSKDKFYSSKLELSHHWKNKSQTYQVKAGTFEFSGGIAGITKKIEPKGEIEIYQLNNFITFMVDLHSLKKDENRSLFDVVSTKIVEESVMPVVINSGNFITSPHPEMIFRPLLREDKLSFDLVTDDKDFPVSDGFTGNGNLEAVRAK